MDHLILKYRTCDMERYCWSLSLHRPHFHTTHQIAHVHMYVPYWTTRSTAVPSDEKNRMLKVWNLCCFVGIPLSTTFDQFIGLTSTLLPRTIADRAIGTFIYLKRQSPVFLLLYTFVRVTNHRRRILIQPPLRRSSISSMVGFWNCSFVWPLSVSNVIFATELRKNKSPYQCSSNSWGDLTAVFLMKTIWLF